MLSRIAASAWLEGRHHSYFFCTVVSVFAFCSVASLGLHAKGRQIANPTMIPPSLFISFMTPTFLRLCSLVYPAKATSKSLDRIRFNFGLLKNFYLKFINHWEKSLNECSVVEALQMTFRRTLGTLLMLLVPILSSCGSREKTVVVQGEVKKISTNGPCPILLSENIQKGKDVECGIITSDVEKDNPSAV